MAAHFPSQMRRRRRLQRCERAGRCLNPIKVESDQAAATNIARKTSSTVIGCARVGGGGIAVASDAAKAGDAATMPDNAKIPLRRAMDLHP